MHTREDTLDHRICEQCPQYTFASIAAALQLSVSRPPIAEYGTRKERLASSSAPSWQSVSGQLGKSTLSGMKWWSWLCATARVFASVVSCWCWSGRRCCLWRFSGVTAMFYKVVSKIAFYRDNNLHRMHGATDCEWLRVTIALILNFHFFFRMPFSCVCLLVEAIVFAQTAEQQQCHVCASVTGVRPYASPHFLCANDSVCPFIQSHITSLPLDHTRRASSCCGVEGLANGSLIDTRKS